MFTQAAGRVPHWLWVLLLGLLVMAAVLLMPRPAAQPVNGAGGAPPDLSEFQPDSAFLARAAGLMATQPVNGAGGAPPDLSEFLSDSAFLASAGGSGDAALLSAMYGRRAFSPIWDKESAAAFRDAVAAADQDGLDPRAYADARLPPPDEHAGAAALAGYDVMLTRTFLRYARDQYSGRLAPGAVYRNVELQPPVFDPASFERALSERSFGRFVHSLAPPHPEYQALRKALARYRTIAGAEGWTQLPAWKAKRRDELDPRLPALRERLAAEGLVSETVTRDSDIIAALTAYQRRSGLEPDGKLGPKTLAMLNITPHERVEQIVGNMERWRWLPRSFEASYLAVNAADPSLKAVVGGRVVLTSRLIVGAPHTPTPMFRAVVTEVTANPVWNVPGSIATNEILPKLRRDPEYLQKNDMYITNLPNGGVRIRQRPGPKNALGLVKLEMPNRFTVYLHDTPAKTLFDRGERHLSHGCMRVQQIMPLASVVLTGDTETGLPLLNDAIATGETKKLRLANPIPVYVLYWTAMAEADGTTRFVPDVYGRDRLLTAALQRKAPQMVAASGCSMGAG